MSPVWNQPSLSSTSSVFPCSCITHSRDVQAQDVAEIALQPINLASKICFLCLRDNQDCLLFSISSCCVWAALQSTLSGGWCAGHLLVIRPSQIDPSLKNQQCHAPGEENDAAQERPSGGSAGSHLLLALEVNWALDDNLAPRMICLGAIARLMHYFKPAQACQQQRKCCYME